MMAAFEASQGISWEDATTLYYVEDRTHGRILYSGPDSESARSIARYAEQVYGRPFPVMPWDRGAEPRPPVRRPQREWRGAASLSVGGRG